jgi:integrase
MKESPLRKADPPKPPKPILPSMTREQVDCLVGQVDAVRHKAIISLFFDSGMRLNELVNVKVGNINRDDSTVTIWDKGNKQRRAPFTHWTADLLREPLRNDGTGENVWGTGRKGIEAMLTNLKQRTGLPCNLHREGLSTLDIMHLGGWQDLSMVLRYTRSITFDDCLKHCQAVLK